MYICRCWSLFFLSLGIFSSWNNTRYYNFITIWWWEMLKRNIFIQILFKYVKFKSFLISHPIRIVHFSGSYSDRDTKSFQVRKLDCTNFLIHQTGRPSSTPTDVGSRCRKVENQPLKFLLYLNSKTCVCCCAECTKCLHTWVHNRVNYYVQWSWLQSRLSE